MTVIYGIILGGYFRQGYSTKIILMKTILHHSDKYILRFDRGEEVMEALKGFCRTEQIEAASFTAIGACGEAVVSFYNLQTKKYEDHHIKENLEITSLLGNVSLLDNQPLVHAHVVLGDSQLHVRGGHAKKLVVSATCEMTLNRHKGLIGRKHDEETGLNLMN
jgi:predicted DNA-binding protein with PD1-like motif